MWGCPGAPLLATGLASALPQASGRASLPAVALLEASQFPAAPRPLAAGGSMFLASGGAAPLAVGAPCHRWIRSPSQQGLRVLTSRAPFSAGRAPARSCSGCWLGFLPPGHWPSRLPQAELSHICGPAIPWMLPDQSVLGSRRSTYSILTKWAHFLVL